MPIRWYVRGGLSICTMRGCDLERVRRTPTLAEPDSSETTEAVQIFGLFCHQSLILML